MFSIRSTPRPQRLLPALAAGWALLTPAELPAEPAPSHPPGANPHWPIAPEVAEEALAQCQLQILSKRYAGRGLTGAYRAEARLPDTGMRFPVKWKSMPGDLDGVNNSPRKELASYQVQRLFLDPEDFVVPTSVARCLPPEAFPDPEEHDRATLPDTRCELGLMSLWLGALTLPEQILDPERFARDPVYAARLADFNLATFLMLHQDGRSGNFLVSEPGLPYRIFAVDNGVAWSGIWYNWFVPNWKHLRVPALRRASVDRLRGLSREDLESLGVLAHFERDASGLLLPATAAGNLDPDDGVRIEDDVVQLGLTEDEIENLHERIEDLIESVDQGEIDLI